MLFNVLKLVHIASIIAWVGGMVFAHFALRPAVAVLEPAVRLRLMYDVLQRFFVIVSVAVILALVSGFWMIGSTAAAVSMVGGRFAMPLSWTIMATLGIVMAAIFGHIRFALFKRLRVAVTAMNWKAGGVAMASIRKWVAINLGIGVVIVVVACLGAV